MDLLITEKNLRHFLKTDSSLETIREALCQSGPTVDRIHDLNGEKLLEIEVITNRVDCASAFGIAREANTILNQRNLKSHLENDPYQTPSIINHQTTKINLKIKDPSKVYRFLAVTIDNVKIVDSKPEIKNNLEIVGQRPINNLVDLTNLFTLYYGIPSHVFDKDKLDLKELIVRPADQNEKITLLDDSKLTLNSGDLVIQDASGSLVDLCCVMGGKHAIVDEHTKNILLIVPVCDPKQVRQTSLFHQKRTLASQIFEKKPDQKLVPLVFNLLVNEVLNTTKGHLSSATLDINNTKDSNKTVSLNLGWLNKFVGQVIPKNQIASILQDLGFQVEETKDNLLVTVPSFRYEDINNQEDLAEEITRIYGFQNIASQFPPLKTPSTFQDPIFNLEKRIRDVLSTSGYFETLNSSLVSKNQINTINQNPDDSLSLKNALSEDLTHLRTNLAISAIQNHQNNKGKSEHLKFFEIGNIYLPTDKEIREVSTLCISSQNILELKKTLNHLFGLLKLSPQITLQESNKIPKFLNKNKSICLYYQDKLVGYLGETNSQTTIKANLNTPITIAEINLQILSGINSATNYQPLSNYPEVIEDINISSKLSLGEIYMKLSEEKTIKKIIYLESFQNKHTFRLYFSSQEKNLTQDDVTDIKSKLLESLS